MIEVQHRYGLPRSCLQPLILALSHSRPFRSLPRRALWRLNAVLTSRGERHGIDWLTYNPLQMRSYHLLARGAARETMLALHEIFPAAQRYVDVGAGTGTFAAEAKRQGRSVLACERSRIGRLWARRQGVECRRFDLRWAEPAELDPPFDLAYCFEVAEHLPHQLGDRLVLFLSDLAPVVVFSAAQPGQGGLGHINERPTEYWIALFERQGQIYRPDLTARLRSRLEPLKGSTPWLPANMTVFRSRRSL